MTSPVIDIVDLSKYYGKIRGIERISLQVSRGDIYGFIGPNGAGKSTTIRILLNLIFPSAGMAKVLDMDVTRESHRIMRRIGYVPSDANAYQSLSVLEFLEYCYRFYRTVPDEQRVKELTAWFELDLNRKIADLSMGNRKKVSIVQSLLHRPELLILDEPTTGLDPLIQSRFFDLLRTENRNGMTIFLSSHILSEVQMFCKKVAIIRDGIIAGVEEIESLRRKQLKKVTIELSDIQDRNSYLIPEYTTEITVTDSIVSYMYSGDMNALLGLLSNRKLRNLTIEEPTLDEIFMHYYN